MNRKNHLSVVGYDQEEFYFEKLNQELKQKFQADLKKAQQQKTQTKTEQTEETLEFEKKAA